MDLKTDGTPPRDSLDENTYLIAPAEASARSSHTPSKQSSTSTRDHAWNILLSTTLSRLGSRTWEFATPLLLLEWSPGSLAAPATLGLASALFRTLVSPWLGGLADEWNRMNTVLIGTSMQALGCLVSVGALILYNFLIENNVSGDKRALERLVSLAVVIAAGVVEALGAQLTSVSVKKEWLPLVFDESANSQVSFSKEKRTILALVDLPDRITLSFINTTMTNIDLISAMFGPILAGWILEVLGFGSDSIQRGFAVIALVNVISFVPEIYLLRRVYLSCPSLQRSRGNCRGNSQSSSQPVVTAENSPLGKKGDSSVEQDLAPWVVWSNHPSGLPLLTLSLASLYMTALSPSGVVLTSYLVTIGLSPTAIGAFRGVGAISGVIGICSFSLLRKGDNGDREADERAALSASIKSIELLRRLSLAFLLLEVVSVLVAAAAYATCDTAYVISPLVKSSEALPWQILLFLGAIVVSRAGLYSFDVGVLEIEQYLVDERYRNAVGSVEGALCSLCEMGMYVLSILLPKPSQFGWQVGVSATAVSFGGVCFAAFLCLYHMHLHHHHEDDDDGHSHHHNLRCHHHNHKHTLQQERELNEFGYHVHLHRHGPLRTQISWSNLRLGW
ncbi:hypothetical protein HJC23_013401 [Cyclotella cryptica]|uniref:Solute carrier family 40 member n=1 Tax=Cyclotella cryptica TaxID=29204 RepID=A0ABD3PWI2_9STRA